MLMTTEAMMSGVMTRKMEKPADFMASSSLFSPICPRVIMDASRVESGRASGRMVQLPHIRNSRMILSPRPLPTSSSI